jgi:hypothetical protein
MKVKIKRPIAIGYLTVILTALVIVSLFFTYPGIKGRVVDAETREPIEGAVVMAFWTKAGGAIGLTYTTVYRFEEAVTDDEGMFELAGVYNPFVDVPSLSIYKKGYVCWNNEYIFPGRLQRLDFKWRSDQEYALQEISGRYDVEKHVSFIKDVTNSSGDKFIRAYQWEVDKATDVRLKRKGLR